MFSTDFNYDQVQSLYLDKIVRKYRNLPSNLKERQAEAIHGLMMGKDVLLLLPTGYGKSLVFMVPGLITHELSMRGSVTVIVAPLVALIHDFLSKLADLKIRGIHVKSISDMEELGTRADIAEPVCIFMSPETLLRSKIMRSVSALSISFLFVDEGHISAEWGKSFRKDYASLHEMRATTDCPLCVMTATLTPKLVSDVKLKTGLRSDLLLTIAISPNRANIYLDLQPTNHDFTKLSAIADEIKTNKNRMKKTLIFVTSVQATYTLFLWFLSQLGDEMLHVVDGKIKGFILNYYSSDTESGAKRDMEDEFAREDGYLRCLVCTVAWGMGIDVRDVNHVVIWGLPTTPMMLWQEIGRAGRNGTPSKATIFPFRSPGIVYEDPSFKLDGDNCVRDYILNFFVAFNDVECDRDRCCSVCSDANATDKREGLTSCFGRKLAIK